MITRADAIKTILASVAPDDPVLCATGMISREAFALKDRDTTFYTIGSMGLVSTLGLGLALANRSRRVVVLDGDAGALMGLGSLAMIVHEAPANLLHIVLDNGCNQSTGAQPSLTKKINLAELARGAGYPIVRQVETLEALTEALSLPADSADGPQFILIKVSAKGTPGIGRILIEPIALAQRFRTAVGEQHTRQREPVHAR